MTCAINIDVKLGSKSSLETVFQTLNIEASEKEIKRGNIEISRENLTLSIIINAQDLVAARSLSNSILRLLKTSTEVLDIVTSENY